MHPITTKSESLEKGQNLNALEALQMIHIYKRLWTADLEQGLKITAA